MKIAQAEAASGNKILALTVTGGDNELKQGIIPRPKPLQSQRQDRGKEPFHTRSFRSTRPSRRRENIMVYPVGAPRPRSLGTGDSELQTQAGNNTIAGIHERL